MALPSPPPSSLLLHLLALLLAVSLPAVIAQSCTASCSITGKSTLQGPNLAQSTTFSNQAQCYTYCAAVTNAVYWDFLGSGSPKLCQCFKTCSLVSASVNHAFGKISACFPPPPPATKPPPPATRSPPPLSNPPPPLLPPVNACPAVNQCDFYMQGSQNTIPTISLASSPDTSIGYPIAISAPGYTGYTPVTINTGQVQFICNSSASPPNNNQFYSVSRSYQAFLAMKTLQPGTAAGFANQFVRLLINTMQANGPGGTFNLNPGSNTDIFPTERRCIIFKTSAVTPGLMATLRAAAALRSRLRAARSKRVHA